MRIPLWTVHHLYIATTHNEAARVPLSTMKGIFLELSDMNTKLILGMYRKHRHYHPFTAQVRLQLITPETVLWDPNWVAVLNQTTCSINSLISIHVLLFIVAVMATWSTWWEGRIQGIPGREIHLRPRIVANLAFISIWVNRWIARKPF